MNVRRHSWLELAARRVQVEFDRVDRRLATVCGLDIARRELGFIRDKRDSPGERLVRERIYTDLVSLAQGNLPITVLWHVNLQGQLIQRRDDHHGAARRSKLARLNQTFEYHAVVGRRDFLVDFGGLGEDVYQGFI